MGHIKEQIIKTGVKGANVDEHFDIKAMEIGSEDDDGRRLKVRACF